MSLCLGLNLPSCNGYAAWNTLFLSSLEIPVNGHLSRLYYHCNTVHSGKIVTNCHWLDHNFKFVTIMFASHAPNRRDFSPEYEVLSKISLVMILRSAFVKNPSGLLQSMSNLKIL